LGGILDAKDQEAKLCYSGLSFAGSDAGSDAGFIVVRPEAAQGGRGGWFLVVELRGDGRVILMPRHTDDAPLSPDV